MKNILRFKITTLQRFYLTQPQSLLLLLRYSYLVSHLGLVTACALCSASEGAFGSITIIFSYISCKNKANSCQTVEYQIQRNALKKA